MRTAETHICITLETYVAWERVYLRSPDNHHVTQLTVMIILRCQLCWFGLPTVLCTFSKWILHTHTITEYKTRICIACVWYYYPPTKKNSASYSEKSLIYQCMIMCW